MCWLVLSGAYKCTCKCLTGGYKCTRLGIASINSQLFLATDETHGHATVVNKIIPFVYKAAEKEP